jgi:REP element-mobilizing transposase RayT
MPRALHRFHGTGDLHFITFSCYQRQPLLDSAPRRDLFLHILERVRRRYCLIVLGYVVMPEHVHLLLSEPQRATLSTAIQALKLGFIRCLYGYGDNLIPGLAKAARPGAPRRSPTGSGKRASTTSMFGQSASGLRNLATCIVIRLSEVSWRPPRCTSACVRQGSRKNSSGKLSRRGFRHERPPLRIVYTIGLKYCIRVLWKSSRNDSEFRKSKLLPVRPRDFRSGRGPTTGISTPRYFLDLASPPAR